MSAEHFRHAGEAWAVAICMFVFAAAWVFTAVVRARSKFWSERMAKAFSRPNVDAALTLRLQQAIEVRLRAAAPPMWLYPAIGSAFVILTALDVTLRISPLTALAAWSVIVAASLNPACRMGIRRVRVATLRSRTPSDALPPLLLLLFSISVTCVVAITTVDSHRRLEGVATICASSAIAAMAWRLASSPMRLFGDDPPIEEFIDRYYRVSYATSLAVLSVLQMNLFSYLGFLQDTAGWNDPSTHLGTVIRIGCQVAIFIAYFAITVNVASVRARVTDASSFATAHRAPLS